MLCYVFVICQTIKMLYHYTSADKCNEILQDGFIKASKPKLKGNPRGVYLTNIPPSTDDSNLIQMMYGNSPNSYNRRDRVEVVFVIKEHHLNYRQIRPNVFYYDGDLNLSRYMHSYHHRS